VRDASRVSSWCEYEDFELSVCRPGVSMWVLWVGGVFGVFVVFLPGARAPGRALRVRALLLRRVRAKF